MTALAINDIGCLWMLHSMSKRSSKAKTRIAITVDPSLVAWVEERVGAGKPFGSVSHAFESGIVALQAQAGKGQK